MGNRNTTLVEQTEQTIFSKSAETSLRGTTHRRAIPARLRHNHGRQRNDPQVRRILCACASTAFAIFLSFVVFLSFLRYDGTKPERLRGGQTGRQHGKHRAEHRKTGTEEQRDDKKPHGGLKTNEPKGGRRQAQVAEPHKGRDYRKPGDKGSDEGGDRREVHNARGFATERSSRTVRVAVRY